MCCEKGCRHASAKGSHYCRAHAHVEEVSGDCEGMCSICTPHSKHGDKGVLDESDSICGSEGCSCCGKTVESPWAFRRLCLTSVCFGVVLGLHFWGALSEPIQILLFLCVYVLAGGDVIWRALRGIGRGQFLDENFLMTLATVCAFCIGEYPEALAVMFFYQLGEYFQGKAVRKSRQSIASLMDIRPEQARVVRNGVDVWVLPEEVQIGDVIRVCPGERVPLDGRVKAGDSMVDSRALTGESVLRRVCMGDSVLSGCVNVRSELKLEVTSIYGESTVSRILALVESSSSHRAPTEKFLTVFSRYYTPVVVGLGLLVGCVSPLFFGGAWGDWLSRACVFFVISCPCALVVSIPLSYFAGIGAAARQGILFKGADVLDALYKVRTFVFDKTGTLTHGTFKVSRIEAVHGGDEAEVLRLAALAERDSHHPIAVSIVSAARERQINLEEACGYIEELPGYGVIWRSQDATVCVGNTKLMQKHGVVYRDYEGSGTVVYVARNGQWMGYMEIADTVKPEAREALRDLKACRVRQTVMLSGDHADIVQSVGEELGLDAFYAELLPADKVERVDALAHHLGQGECLAFVGDGLNDAPVLMRSDVGIAMGGMGVDAAIEAADIVLMTDDLLQLPKAMKISRYTRRIVLQNIGLAIGIKVIFMILGAIGVMPIYVAVFADVGVLLLAVFNAMRLIIQKGMWD